MEYKRHYYDIYQNNRWTTTTLNNWIRDIKTDYDHFRNNIISVNNPKDENLSKVLASDQKALTKAYNMIITMQK